MQRFTLLLTALGLVAAASCSSHDATAPGTVFTNLPCSATGTLTLGSAQTARVDCSNGGTTVTLAGNGASYLVVAQFAADLVANSFVDYHLSSGTTVGASRSPFGLGATAPRFSMGRSSMSGGSGLPPRRLEAKQFAFDGQLRARARLQLASGAWHPATSRTNSALRNSTIRNTVAPPAVGSTRGFRVSNSAGTFGSVGAQLAFAGPNVLLYIDTLAPANGFTPAQLQSFGQLFDQTLYPIDTAAFGPPTDVDLNGRVIMLMSPTVNALTSTTDCQTQGYVAGYFQEEDLGGGAADPNSNNAEIFYSIVPDPNGTSSCAHSVADVGSSVPATFLHELQHLISFSQHVVVHGGNPEYGWLDEGLSIVAEELGSVYYEQKCPGTACRTDPSQIFPDSSQGFVETFLYDSYQYALLPDTASLTLHDDSEGGFSWRGGDWLLMRWLGDQMGAGFYKRLDQNSVEGVANIQSVTGQAFPAMFANFGLALYTDSLPTLPRATAPAVDRFVSRNIRQLWARVYLTDGPPSFPLEYPVQVFAITADTSDAVMDPGAMSYFRLDTPANVGTVSLQFAGPGGLPIPAAAKPQLAIFRLPPGQ
jgi:hypothetical protein